MTFHAFASNNWITLANNGGFNNLTHLKIHFSRNIYESDFNIDPPTNFDARFFEALLNSQCRHLKYLDYTGNAASEQVGTAILEVLKANNDTIEFICLPIILSIQAYKDLIIHLPKFKLLKYLSLLLYEYINDDDDDDVVVESRNNRVVDIIQNQVLFYLQDTCKHNILECLHVRFNGYIESPGYEHIIGDNFDFEVLFGIDEFSKLENVSFVEENEEFVTLLKRGQDLAEWRIGAYRS